MEQRHWNAGRKDWSITKQLNVPAKAPAPGPLVADLVWDMRLEDKPLQLAHGELLQELAERLDLVTAFAQPCDTRPRHVHAKVIKVEWVRVLNGKKEVIATKAIYPGLFKRVIVRTDITAPLMHTASELAAMKLSDYRMPKFMHRDDRNDLADRQAINNPDAIFGAAVPTQPIAGNPLGAHMKELYARKAHRIAVETSTVPVTRLAPVAPMEYDQNAKLFGMKKISEVRTALKAFGADPEVRTSFPIGVNL
jgi:hypothetical protein